MKCPFMFLLLTPAMLVFFGCAGSGSGPATTIPSDSARRSGDVEERRAADTSEPTTAPQPDAEAQPVQQKVVATVNGQPITLEQLQRPLIEAHGLTILLNLVQLELARQNAAAEGVAVTDEDVEREHELTLRQMFESAYIDHKEEIEELNRQREEALRRLERASKADAGDGADTSADTGAEAASASDQDTDEGAERQEINRQFDERIRQAEAEFRSDMEQYFEQFLTQERISRAEFDLVLQTNAHLRKIAEPHVERRITDEAMEEAFRTLYGETVRIRHVQVANMQEIAEARRRLAAGQPFEQVAREMSRNPDSAMRGGELPVFSRATSGLPDAFKDTAFGLEVGEVSDPVQAEGAYHLIRLEERFEPRAVRFEDVQDSVRQTLYDQWMQVAMRELRSRLGQQVVQAMQIEQPELRRQFEMRMTKDE